MKQKLFNLVVITQFGYVYQVMLEMEEGTAIQVRDYFHRYLKAFNIQHNDSVLQEVDQEKKDKILFTHRAYPDPQVANEFIVEYLEGYNGLGGKAHSNIEGNNLYNRD